MCNNSLLSLTGSPPAISNAVKRYLAIFNLQTAVVISLSLASSYICIKYQLKLYVDFLILDFIIIFPITFSLGLAFARREKAIQYLSLFKASLQSVFYCFQNSKLDNEKKEQLKTITEDLSVSLLKYLSETSKDSAPVQEASHAIFSFVSANEPNMKNSFSTKVLLYLFRMNESIEFLLATHRHRTPWGPRAIVLFVIYCFVISYPATLLHDVRTDGTFGYIALSTTFNAFLLISFFNVQHLLENPFLQKGKDAIRLNDFRFLAGVTMAKNPMPFPEIENQGTDSDTSDDK